MKNSSKSSNRLVLAVVEAGVGFGGATKAERGGIWEGFVDLVGDVIKSENSSSSSIVG